MQRTIASITRRRWLSAVLMCSLAVAVVVSLVLTGTTPLGSPTAEGGARVVVAVDPDADPADVTQTAEILAERVVTAFGEGSGSVDVADRTIVLTGPADGGATLESLARAGTVRFRPTLEAESSPPGLVCNRRDDSDASAEVVLAQCNPGNGMLTAALRLGPTDVTEGQISGITSETGADGVTNMVVRFNSGSGGVDRYNALAQHCIDRDDICPTGAMAMSLDGVVLAAPSIERADVGPGGVNISWIFQDGELQGVTSSLATEPLPALVQVSAPSPVSPSGGSDAAMLLWLGVLLAASALLAVVRHRASGLSVLAGAVFAASTGWVALAVMSASDVIVLGPLVAAASTAVVLAVTAATWWALERRRRGVPGGPVAAGSLTVATTAAAVGTVIGIGGALWLPATINAVAVVVWVAALVLSGSVLVARSLLEALPARVAVRERQTAGRLLMAAVAFVCLALPLGAGVVTATARSSVEVTTFALATDGDAKAQAPDAAALDAARQTLSDVPGSSLAQVRQDVVVTSARTLDGDVVAQLASQLGASQDEASNSTASLVDVPVQVSSTLLWVVAAVVITAIALWFAFGPVGVVLTAAVSIVVAGVVALAIAAGAIVDVVMGAGAVTWAVLISLGAGAVHATSRHGRLVPRAGSSNAATDADPPAEGDDRPTESAVGTASVSPSPRRALTRRERDARGDTGAVV